MSRLSVADFLIGCVEWFLCNHVRFIQVSGVGISRETYDTVEVQDCHSQLRTCMQRISDVEAINVDLEARLESQAREYIELESDAAESQAPVRFCTQKCQSNANQHQVGMLEESIRSSCQGGIKLEVSFHVIKFLHRKLLANSC
jgi:hypothetical protein